MNPVDPYAGERLKLSHFHERQAVLNLREAWSSWNGYKFADYYYDEEYAQQNGNAQHRQHAGKSCDLRVLVHRLRPHD